MHSNQKREIPIGPDGHKRLAPVAEQILVPVEIGITIGVGSRRFRSAFRSV